MTKAQIAKIKLSMPIPGAWKSPIFLDGVVFTTPEEIRAAIDKINEPVRGYYNPIRPGDFWSELT